MSEETKTLENFEGFENASEIDFFGESSADATSVETVIEEVKKDDINPKNEDKEDIKVEKKEPEAEEQPDIDFFGEGGKDAKTIEVDDTEGLEGITNGTEDEEEEEKQPQIGTNVGTLSFLKEKGLVNFELEEGEELTEEKAEAILEDSYEESVENRVAEIMQELPDEVKNIVKYSMNGGNIGQLLSTMASQPTAKITEDLDLEDEANQVLVVSKAREALGEDQDTIDTYIDFLKESGKLKAQSEKDKAKIVSAQAKLTEQEAERTKLAKKQAKENHRKFKNEITSFVLETEKVGDLSLTKEDKKILPSFISDRNKQLEDGRTVTGLQEALYKALNDKEKTIQLAKILQSDFDFSSIKKAGKTETTREIKRDLTRSKNNSVSKTGKTIKKTQLADFF